MLDDLKHAVRELRKNPSFTLVTVLTLALGIGANTAIFGVVNRLMLNPLPYKDADRIVNLTVGSARLPFGFPVPAYMITAWREQAKTLDGIEAYATKDVLAYDDRGARLVHAMSVTSGLAGFLAVQPVLGRSFADADEVPGAPATVLLSYETWRRDYGGARDVLGRAITLDDVTHVVIGVMPPRWDAFAGAMQAELWLPLPLAALAGSPAAAATPQAAQVVARVRRGMPAPTVQSELDAIARRAREAAANPFVDADFVARVREPSEGLLFGNARDALLVLLAAVGLVLLVACANAANLLLARGTSRARELALRTALGASGWRLIRAVLTECVVLALAAGAVGIAIGWLSLRVLVRLGPITMPALRDVALDSRVLAFTLGVSVLTALVFGLVPALQTLRQKPAEALRHGASGVVRGGGGARLRKLLVATEVAISVVRLVSAGLLVRSVVYLQNVDPGLDTTNLFRVQLSLPRGRYQKPASRDVLAEQLLERVRSLPGVAGATQANSAPPNAVFGGGALDIRGVALSEAEKRAAYAFNFVRPDYFSVLGIRLLEGRTFAADEAGTGRAVVLNRGAAERFWPNASALGAQLKLFGGDYGTVVGVVEDVRAPVFGGVLGTDHAPQFYFPFDAERAPYTFGAPPTVLLIVRSAGDPANVIPQIRAAARALDPEIAIPDVTLLETAFAATLSGPRFNMALLTAFAVLALVLAAVGLAGVIGYEVSERTHEIGIRIALGARTENVRRLAMRHGMAPAVIGVACGVVAALAATRLASSLLYGVQPTDPLTFVGVAALLLAVAVGASWLPARRATRVSPIVALRAD
jgi:putative ABC transport system permease protein